MLSGLYRSFMVTLLLALILCGAYPLAVMEVGKVFFNRQVNGGLLQKEGETIGAELIGQNFSKPEYFHPRPSAAGEKGYDAAGSSGSNLGPTNPKLMENIKANIKKVVEENPGIEPNQIPVDLVTASASGLDPHISPASAFLQMKRIAKTRKISTEEIKVLVQSHIEKPDWGILGEERVNVLLLNLALDNLH